MSEEMAPEQRRRSVCGATIVKQEPAETDPLPSPKRESKDIFMKEETLILHEWEVLDDFSGAEDPVTIKEEESSPPEDYLRHSVFNIEKTEGAEAEEEAVSTDDGKELKYEVESASSSREPERAVPNGVEDENCADDTCGVATKVYLTAGRGNRRQCTTKQEASCGSKNVTRHLVHRSAMCKKSSLQFQDLKEHTDIDTHEFLHSCSKCHKTFKSSCDLKRHIRVHTGERPYKCGVCKKSFTQSSSLKVHSLLHSGERPYSCGICNKTFTYLTSLRRHSLLHSGERPYICGICKKTFPVFGTLKNHLFLHTGERPYSCGVCNKTFIQRRRLKQHLQMHSCERCKILKKYNI